MSGSWGKNLRLTIFGESHGASVGVVMDGLPPGLAVEEASIQADMARRRPGGVYASARKEQDRVEIQSGVYKGKTTGTPLCAIIKNEDADPQAYLKAAAIARPSHADYTGHVRYRGHHDPRGGGHFSGRLTAPLVFAGALARAYLGQYGVQVGAHLLQMGALEDTPFDSSGAEIAFHTLKRLPIPMQAQAVAGEAAKLLEALRMEGDSVGGVVECMALHVPAGWGDPFFYSLESAAASLLFSVPGVKGVCFGAGFSFGGMRGSEANDPFAAGASTRTNKSGGINGGITNGMPVCLQVAFRPTPSIAKPQTGYDMETGAAVPLEIAGRHDPCIALRGVPVVEAALLLALMDNALEVV